MKPLHVQPLEGESYEAFTNRFADTLERRLKSVRKRDSDRRTDHDRRTLAGARLPREMVECYRSAAKAKGLSLYRWVAEALEERYRGGW